MRVLLSTIGSRGDVQPLVALALQLKTLGHGVRLCVPPDFRDWIESLGMPVTPMGPALRPTGRVSPFASPPIPDRRRQLVEASVATQFETLMQAAQGSDVMVGATALQIAAPSVAEKEGIPYLFAVYCPTALPSPHHAPPILGMLGDRPATAPVDYATLWNRDAERFNTTFGAALNSHRAALGLATIDDVRSYVFTDRPWLAADAALAPWPDPSDGSVLQTGAWIMPDERPLSPELAAFLDAGEPPIYLGFGSIRAPEDLTQVTIEAARGLGRRTVVSRGWADLSLFDGERDCLSIGEVNQQALFKRVAAVIHHGGAGTTTASARAGAPQIVIPQMYDQHYWAERVHHLGIGTAHAPGRPTIDSLTSALGRALHAEVAARARSITEQMQSDGARVAAECVIAAALRNSS